MIKDKIKILKSTDADTRTAKGEVSKEELLKCTKSHIQDVNNVGNMLMEMFIEQIKRHDHTKIDNIDEFLNDFNTRYTGYAFKQLPWWQIHKTERHHLNDSVPDDVNLLDVLEMVIDCTVAGLARKGSVYDITIPNDVLVRAINNTKDLIINNTEVIDINTNEV